MTRTTYLRRISFPEYRITERARRPIEPISSDPQENPEFHAAEVALTTRIIGAWITNDARKNAVCNACAELSTTIQESTSPHYDDTITHHDIMVECVRIEGAVAQNAHDREQYLTELRNQIQIAASMHELASLFGCPDEAALTY